MDFFISAAHAQAGGEPGSAWGSLIMLVVFFAIFYFLIIRPHQKRMNEHKKMVDALSRNDEVVTQGGILGRIEEIDESFVTLEVAQGVKLRVQKQAVTGVMPKGTFRAQ
jgi:preprotein translocase subunit YajC